MSTINERISSIIEENGLTRTAFGEKVGLSQSYVSAICVGRKVPSARTISDICRKFGINEKWVLTGEGDMNKAVYSLNPEYAKFIIEAVNDNDRDFRKRLVSVLSELEGPELELVLAMAETLVKQSEQRKAAEAQEPGEPAEQ